jgi:microcystin-dependent protein
MEPYIAQIMLVGFNFAPKGWAQCAAQLLSIQQNAALFSILGTTYGGNGIQTFGLPDLRGRTSMHWGMGAGQPDYVLGELGGTENVTILASSLPSHNHPLNVSNVASNASSPSNTLAAVSQTSISGMLYGSPSNTTMATATVANNGGNQPVSILQPYLVLNYLIATSGIFPSRN